MAISFVIQVFFLSSEMSQKEMARPISFLLVV
jgi:hypothetical protein